MRQSFRRRAAIPVVLTAVVALAGCAGSAGSTPTPHPSLSALCADPVVATCTIDEGSASLTVGAGVSPDDVRAFLRRAHTAAAADDTPGVVTVIQLAPAETRPDPDMSVPRLWTLTAYPGELADVETHLGELLAVAAVPGTFGIASDTWPHVDVADIDLFGAVFHAVSALPLFANGGSYRLAAAAERLRIEHTPAWVTAAFVDTVIDIAVTHPGAEVLLEAPGGGAEPPALYVSHLTADQAAAVARRLNAFAAPLPDGVAGVRIPYTLGTVGSDGITYTNGDVGGEP